MSKFGLQLNEGITGIDKAKSCTYYININIYSRNYIT